MAYLSYIEKKIICRFFGIADGYIFNFWVKNGTHNKNDTKELIYEACGINIYKDENYRHLSQEKCIRKIWDEENPQTIAKLLKKLIEYFNHKMETNCFWSDEDRNDYHQIQEIIKRLEQLDFIELPKKLTSQDLVLIGEDIKKNIREQKHELIIDRLHTYTCGYIRTLCDTHKIQTKDLKGNELPLHSLTGKLVIWYIDNGYCETDFSQIACKNAINLFDKYNQVRNKNSAAHPNKLLSNAEAEYAVKIIAETLIFLNELEKIHSQNSISQDNNTFPWEIDDDQLPF